ncbi:hypothetical protein [Methylocystis parvus]|uniref:hypothetical protein n=1 Tax=Methylocystis parvus TaxID=134 RepID=UPI003C757671
MTSAPDLSAKDLWRDAYDGRVCREIGDSDGLKAAILRLAVFQPTGPRGKRAALDAFRCAAVRDLCAGLSQERPAALKEAS